MCAMHVQELQLIQSFVLRSMHEGYTFPLPSSSCSFDLNIVAVYIPTILIE